MDVLDSWQSLGSLSLVIILKVYVYGLLRSERRKVMRQLPLTRTLQTPLRLPVSWNAVMYPGKSAYGLVCLAESRTLSRYFGKSGLFALG